MYTYTYSNTCTYTCSNTCTYTHIVIQVHELHTTNNIM